MTTPELRPLGIGEIFDIAINVYRRHAGTLFRLVLFVVAPVAVLGAVIEASAAPSDDFVVEEREIWAYVAAVLGSGLLGFLGTTIATGACFRAVADAYLGGRPEWRQSLRFAAGRIHSILWVTVLAAVFALLGAILCILPGIYLWIGFSVAVPVLLTEGRKGTKALGRSRALVRGRWWPVFAVVLLGGILTAIVGGALEGLAAALVRGDSEGSLVSVVVDALAGTVSSTLTVPFTASFVIVMYFDLRVRKEAFDLQLLAEQVGVEPPGGIPPPPAPAPPTGGERPPYWPPPPGWTPGASEPPE